MFQLHWGCHDVDVARDSTWAVRQEVVAAGVEVGTACLVTPEAGLEQVAGAAEANV